MKFNYFHLLLVLVTFIVGCSDSTDVNEITLIKGGKTYGGEVKFTSADKVQSLFPLSVIDKYSFRITGQLFESLLKIDATTSEVVPVIAESYEINNAGDVYTFKIRKGIQFHEDECFENGQRELTAEDVKYSLEFACSGLKLNTVTALVSHIKGGQEYFESTAKSLNKKGVSGIKIINGNSVQITLNKPFVGFEKMLTQQNIVIFPKEAYEKYNNEIAKHPVGTGPFKLESSTDKGIRLIRNDNYWKKDDFGNQLPYLSAISIDYSNGKKDEMLAFRSSEIDILMEIPVQELENVLGTLQEAKDGKNVKHKVESANSISTEYIGFNHSSPIFSKKEVRLAILYALDQEKLIDKQLNGEGNPPTNGFIPLIEGQDNAINMPQPNIEKAKSLLAAAGYPNGNGFPKMDIYVNSTKGSRIHRLMEGVVKDLKTNLNIDLTIKLCDYQQREAAILSGEAQIWRAGWIADYPDPQSFLNLLYSGGMTKNQFNLNNTQFDKNYDAAMVELSEEKRSKLLINCAQQVMDEAFIVPLVNDNMLIMVNARVKGITANSMEQIDFTEVFIKEPKATN